jgi:hypothetical protein
MDTSTLLMIAGGAVLLLVLVAVVVQRVRARRRGPAGTSKLHPDRPLTADERTRVTSQWYELQGAYVDDPRVAVHRADTLLRHVLDLRGVPNDRLDDRAAAAAFVRPALAEQYRLAHDVFVDIESEKPDGPASERDQRRAFLVYRELVMGFAQPDEDEFAEPEEHVVADLRVMTGQPVA